MKTILRLFLLLFLLSGCVVDESNDSDDPDTGDRVRVGDRLPSFSVGVVDGGTSRVFSSDDLFGTTVIVFFHTSCRDCQRELPELNDYYIRHRDDPGFQMVAVARAESAPDIETFWQANGLSIPYSPQEDRHVYELFATTYIPRVYICSPQGVVLWVGIEDFDMPE